MIHNFVHNRIFLLQNYIAGSTLNFDLLGEKPFRPIVRSMGFGRVLFQ